MRHKNFQSFSQYMYLQKTKINKQKNQQLIVERFENQTTKKPQ